MCNYIFDALYHCYMFKKCKCVRCFMIDFSRVFDMTADHLILLAKLSRLYLPAFALNWIISFLAGLTQVVMINGVYHLHCLSMHCLSIHCVSSPLFINTRIRQRSGVLSGF